MRLRHVEGNGRTYVVLNTKEAIQVGVTLKKQIVVRGVTVRVMQPPANALPARTVYTYEEAVRMAELILAGARWCEYKRMHFLTVLPWEVPPV